jgi:hypothetical protein
VSVGQRSIESIVYCPIQKDEANADEVLYEDSFSSTNAPFHL